MVKEKNKNKWRKTTNLVHKAEPRTAYGETGEALFLTSGYVYDSAEQAQARFLGEDDGYQYSRFGNPTVRSFEKRMIAFESADFNFETGFEIDARATATGMAAVTAAMLCYLKAGDHVVAAKALFGSCRYIVETLLPRYGIKTTLIDGTDLTAWESAALPETKIFFLESPTNPMLDILDIEAISEIAHRHDSLMVVDNVFATPVLQNPFTLGADIVIYSATKHIDGQGRCLGGIVLGRKDWIDDYLANFIRQTGPSISQFNAWVMLKSLETMELRVHAHCDRAEKLTEALSIHPKVSRLVYPGNPSHPHYELAKKQMQRGGSLFSFEVSGGQKAAFQLANNLQLVKISNNLGDAKSLITHPSTTTHHKLEEQERLKIGITPGTLRVSVGLEDPQDLIDDFAQALEILDS